jgi:mono/diheme cytochrome c family protein
VNRGQSRILLHGALTCALLVATVASFATEGTATTDALPLSAEPLSARGKTLFLAKGCIACHALSVPGDPAFSGRPDLQLGPSLAGIAATAASRRPGQSAERYIRESIVSPQSFITPSYATTPSSPSRPQMPAIPLSADEADALVTFLLDPR